MMNFFRDQKWPLSKTLACSLVACCLFLGSRGLYQSTEGRYAECARQTMESGHWLEPVLNGHDHWTKPPLTYLSIIGPMKVAGVNTWTARAYLVPFFLLAVWGVWLLGRHFAEDRRVGDLSALVFATSWFPFSSSTVVSTDLPLAAFMIAAQACFWRAVRTSSRLSVYLAWVFLALAFMTKGPPSLLLLPALIVVWWLLPRGQRKAVCFFAPGAIALFFALASSWYLWEASRHPGLLHYWVQDEVINRSTTDEFRRNPEFYMNFVFYVPILLFGCWPWGGWLLYVRRKAWMGALKGLCAEKGASLKVRAGAMLSAVKGWPLETTWSVLAIGLPIVVFFLSRSKLPYYVLPLFGPIAVVIARGLLRAYERDAAPLWKWATVAGLSFWFVAVAVKGLAPLNPRDRDMKYVYNALVHKAKGIQPGQLAIYGTNPLNGLQFYLQSEIPTFAGKDQEGIRRWAAANPAQDRYVILRPRQTNVLAQCVAPARVEFIPFVNKWALMRIPAAP